VLVGGRTDEELAAYWPTVASGTDPFAGFLNKPRGLVVSSTLTTLQGDHGAGLGRLGSLTLVGSPLRAGVLDVLELFVVSVLIASGKRLFGDRSLPWRFIHSSPQRRHTPHWSAATASTSSTRHTAPAEITSFLNNPDQASWWLAAFLPRPCRPAGGWWAG
jgi:dihydrofolate reductase